MRRILKNNHAVPSVFATIMVVLIVSSVSTAVFVFGTSQVEKNQEKTMDAQVNSEIDSLINNIGNIVYKDENSKSVNNFKISDKSYIETKDKDSRTAIWYSLYDGYDFDVTDIDHLSNPESSLSIDLLDAPPGGKITRSVALKLEDHRSTPCFLSGTMVLMSDGSFIPIEDIKKDQHVMSYDLENNCYTKGVVEDILFHPKKDMTDYYLIINDDLKVTPNHRVYSDASWVEIGRLNVGDRLFNGVDDVNIRSLQMVYEKNPTYDITVDIHHNYFVKINDEVILVHNEEKGLIGGGTLPSEGPTASFTWFDRDGEGEGTIIFFDASDSQGENLEYRWDWTSDSKFDTEFSQEDVTFNYDYGDTQSHYCTLQVRDASLNTDSCQIEVQASTGESGNPSGGAESGFLTMTYPVEGDSIIRGMPCYVEWDYTGNPDYKLNHIYLYNDDNILIKTLFSPDTIYGTSTYTPKATVEQQRVGIPGNVEEGLYYLVIELKDEGNNLYTYSGKEQQPRPAIFNIISGTPYLYYNTKVINAEVEVSSIDDSNYNFYIYNTGGDRLDYDIEIQNTPCDWLQIKKEGEGEEFGNSISDSVDNWMMGKKTIISFDSNGYSIGDELINTLEINVNDGDEYVEGFIDIKMKVLGPPELGLSDTDDLSAYFVRSGTDPWETDDSPSFKVYNKGVGEIEYVITSSSPIQFSSNFDSLVSEIEGISNGEKDEIFISFGNIDALDFGDTNINIIVKGDDTSTEDIEYQIDPINWIETLTFTIKKQTITPTILESSRSWNPADWYRGSTKIITYSFDVDYGGTNPVDVYLCKGDYESYQEALIGTDTLPLDYEISWSIGYDDEQGINLESGEKYWFKFDDRNLLEDSYGRSNYFTFNEIGGFDSGSMKTNVQDIEVSDPATLISFDPIEIEGVVLVELWDDSQTPPLEKPVGRIFIFDSDSIICNIFNEDRYKKMIIQNGGNIISSNGDQQVKYSPFTNLNKQQVGLRITQMLQGSDSLSEFQGGSRQIHIYSKHLASYKRDEIENAYFVKMRFFGDYSDAWRNHLITKHRDKIALDSNNALKFIYSDPNLNPSNEGVKFLLFQSVVEYSIKL